jgi:glycosyltransferase involved in cell wall biosynthesis
MLSRDLGGIQKAFVNYNNMLTKAGNNVLNIASKNSQIIQEHKELDKYAQIKNLCQWDIYSIFQLRKIFKKFDPDCIIAHTSRAIKFCHYARFNTKYKLIAAAHNYNYKWFGKCDYVFSITKHLADFLNTKQIPQDLIYIVGNSLEITRPFRMKDFSNTIILGTLSRLVPQKGLNIFLRSVCLLQQKGNNFKVIIGGDGQQRAELEKLAQELDIKNIEFAGWVNDKDQFFDKIDIFCLPSLIEPFGIVTLEAMMYGVPIVATRSEGPSQNISDGQNGLLCELGDAQDMAEKIWLLSNKPDLAKALARNAYSYVVNNFSSNIIQNTLNNHLKHICSK